MDLSTQYLGLSLKNPLMVGACPLSENVDVIRTLEDAGAAAIVMHSLFEEQISHNTLNSESEIDEYENRFSDTVYTFPESQLLDYGPDDYVDQLSILKAAVGIPVIGSINCAREGSWVEYTRLIEQAGADAVELNLYFLPTGLDESSTDLEDRCIRIVEAVRAELTIPLAVKLSPFFTALPHFAKRLCDAGANGIVLFNRFYQPDVDLKTMAMKPALRLSSSSDLPARLRWLAVLYGRIEADLALTGGVHSGADIVKSILSGATVVQSVSAVLKDGPRAVKHMLAELRAWMEEKNYDSLEQIAGSMSLKRYPQPEAIERANYLRVLNSWKAD